MLEFSSLLALRQNGLESAVNLAPHVSARDTHQFVPGPIHAEISLILSPRPLPLFLPTIQTFRGTEDRGTDDHHPSSASQNRVPLPPPPLEILRS